MKLFKKNKLFFALFILFLAIDIFYYWRLWDTFFQQDEWGLFGRAIFQLQDLPYSVFRFSGAHFHPMGNIIWIIFYKLFGLNAFYFGVFAIFIHVLTAVTAYYFFGLFLEKKIIRFFMSLLFLVSFPTKQVVVWYAANPYIIPSILGILLFFIYLSSQKKYKTLSLKSLINLFIIWLIALLFREEPAVLIFLFPLYVYLFWGKELFFKLKKKIFILCGTITLLLGIRYLFEKFFGDNVVYEQGNIATIWLYNFLLGFPKMFIQNIIGLEQLWELSRDYNTFAFPNRIVDGLIVESAVFEHIVFMLLVPFIFLLGYFFPKMNEKEKKILFFSVVWIIFSSVIVGLQSRRLHTFESRYLYLGSLGVILFLYSIASVLLRKVKKGKNTLIVVILILCLSFCVYSYVNTRKTINTVYLPYSIERVVILNQIKKLHPNIPKQAVFFVECRQKSDCIPNGLVLPFQSGVGQMLLVLYAQQNEKAYAPFFEDFYLWDWEEQDYKEIGGYGFGYYRERKKLYEDASIGKFLPSEIIGLSYDRSENKVYDITDKIREDVKNSVKSERQKYGQEEF